MQKISVRGDPDCRYDARAVVPISRLPAPCLALGFALACGCGDSTPRTPAQGRYGQITTQPSTNVGPARPPQPLVFNPSAVLTCVQTELSPATLFHTESK